MYTNGIVALSTNQSFATNLPLNSLTYVPNVDSPFTVGTRSDIAFPWAGNVAEAAIYPTALSAARVAAHHTAATSAPATYAATVLADNPLLYDRYQAPPNAVITNSGTLGPADNGILLADAQAAAPGPRPPTYPYFEAGNYAVSFDAQGGAARLPAFNFNTNTITISGWVNASNLQSSGAGIVVCDSGTTGAGLVIDGTFGGLGLGYYWNNEAATYGWSPSHDAGLPTLPDSDWAFVALVVQPTEADVYIASASATSPVAFTGVTNYHTHVIQAFDGPTLVGTDAGNPTYSFNGAIDEVAIWNRALSSGELYTEYATAVGGLAPVIFGDPPSPDQPIVAGDTLTLPVNAGGTPDLSYQWRLNGTNIPAPLGTNVVYSKPNFSIAGDSGNYDVIVTNNFGAVTSGVAVVTGQIATAPVVTQRPAGAIIYPGGVLNLSVTATGGGLVYQWNTNGVAIGGANRSTYSVYPVTTNNAATYTVTITNTLGATNVGPAVVIVPVLTTNSFAGIVDADAPEAWWRLDETGITNGTIMQDGMGRHSGVYTNNGGLISGSPGAIHGGVAGTALTFTGDGSYGYVPYFSALSSPKFTLEIWAMQSNVVNGVTAVSSFDSSPNGYGIAAQTYWQGLNGGGSFGSAPGTTAGYDPTIRSGQWIHLVILYNPGGNATYPYQIYVNGVTDGYIWGNGGTSLNNSDPFIVGGYGTGLASILKNYFVGSIDEVAFYPKLLTSAQIQAHYAAAFLGVPPTFTSQPQSQNAIVGDNINLSVSTAGAPPITLQWKKNGSSIPGQTNSTLTINNVFYTTSSEVYSCVATNGNGSAVSSNAVITVYAPPSFANLTNGLVLHMKFEGDYSDSSGHGNNGTAVGTPEFVPGIIGSQALFVNSTNSAGVDNYVTLGKPSDLLFGSAVDFSVAYWCKLGLNYTNGDLPFLCSSTNSYGGIGITFAPSYQRGGWSWWLGDSSGKGAGLYGPDNSISDGNWHHLVHTFSRTGLGSTFLDGVMVNQTPISGLGSIDPDPGNPQAVINIGQGGDGTYGEKGGFDLDDIGVWRRSLTDIEARSIYLVAQQYGKSFDVPGSVMLYPYSLAGGQMGIAWQTGTLKMSHSVTGPWTPVPGAAPPFYQFTPTTTNTFYRVSP